MKEEVVARSLSELDSFRGEAISPENFLAVSEVRRQALLQNPFRTETDTICQWVGFADGKPAGFNYIFPIRVWADGKSYSSTTGSSLNVEEWARKTSLGLILPAKGVELMSKDGIAIAASCSQMAIPVHQINGYRYFKYPRYIALWKSRSVVETVVPKRACRFVSFCVDCVLKMYACVLIAVVKFALRKYCLEKVSPEDTGAHEHMAKIVAADMRRFREDHTAAWFRWHLNCSFSSDGPCTGWLLWRKHDRVVVGFGLTKRRFYEQASHRGFKNVWLGSVMEWGLENEEQKLSKWLVAALALVSARDCDACDVALAEPELASFVRHMGWRQVGEANVGIKVMKNFPFFADKAIREISNWRIRPAMGDNGLS